MVPRTVRMTETDVSSCCFCFLKKDPRSPMSLLKSIGVGRNRTTHGEPRAFLRGQARRRRRRHGSTCPRAWLSRADQHSATTRLEDSPSLSRVG